MGFMSHALALEPSITELLDACNARALATNTTKELWFTGHRYQP